ncbi:hypothetical protein [Aestuariibaculum sediminum]|uniref:Uncharacterized protein n=1 Tax=Aestuariibaculum sediminum TaxID=2770637 RepID=A0A8J6U9U5_9FLAO|nr:hypothetical protein [Aestuariibaculum sediminum]MBD0833762.1 hypothetical protein [Aestuariibaculum sediminum]
MISEQKLLEIEKRCKDSTSGPWKAFIEGRDHDSGGHFIMTGEGDNRGEDLEIDGARMEDYDFIANAKQDIPILISEVRRLRELLGGYSK